MLQFRGLRWVPSSEPSVGYYFGSREEYGGVIVGPLMGAALGAPIGMILVLLTTP